MSVRFDAASENSDAILAQTGLSGAVAAVQDDPDSPDGTWLVNP